MSFHSRLQRQIGGLLTGVIPYNSDDPISQGTFASILEESTRAEARGHGAEFDPVGFQKVLHALARKSSARKLRPIEALIFVAGWHLCCPIFIGANLNNRAMSLCSNGQNINAETVIYSEDVCIPRAGMAKLVASKPAGAWFPEGGIGKHFVKLSMRHYAENGMNGGIFPKRQLFEYAIDNTAIVRLQRELGAELGAYPKSGLFRLEGLTADIQPKLTIPLEPVWGMLPDGTIDPDNFVLPWESDSGKQKHYASFARNVSSFTGKEVFQCEMSSEGEPLSEAMAKNIAASSLKAGNQIILQEREERAVVAKHCPSPSIPLGGTPKERFEALFAYGGSELAAPVFMPMNYDQKVIYNVHIKDNPTLVSAMGEMAPIRKLGSKTMQTGSLDLTDGMREAGTLGTAAKLRLVQHGSCKPYFDLAA